MLVVTERDQIEDALRRLVAHQGVEAAFAENLARPRAAGRARSGCPGGVSVVEAGRMRQQKCGHAGSGAL